MLFLSYTTISLDRKVSTTTSALPAEASRDKSLAAIKRKAEKVFLIVFDESYNLPLTGDIVERAVKLRQIKNMSLGDTIIAATALEHGCELWTADEEDFVHIDGLLIRNPLKS